MPRKNNRKPAIIKDLKDGVDPIVIAPRYGVTPSYVYRLGKLQRMADHPEKFQTANETNVGAPVRVPVGDLFTQRAVSSLHRHGGDIYEDYLREFQGNRGIQIYKEMGNDPICAAVLSAIKMTLRRVKWYATGATDKQDEAVDFLNQSMDDLSNSFSDFIDQALSMLQYGFAPFEVVWKIRRGTGLRPGPKTSRSRYSDGLIGWKKFVLIGQDTLAPGQGWIFDEKDGSLRGLNQQPPPGAALQNVQSLISIPIEKMILFRTTTEKDNPEGRSVFRAQYSSWYYKKNLEEIEAISAERLGAGFPVFYLGDDVSKGADSTSDIQEFRTMTRNIRVDEQMGLTIPFKKMGTGALDNHGVLFELVSPPARGNIDFGTIIQRHEKRMAMVGLAQFIHLGMDNIGSQALATVTTDFFQLAVAAWADSIMDTFNRFAVDPLFALNRDKFDPEDHPIVTHSDISTPDLKIVADYINKTVGAKVIEPDDKLEESLRRIAGFPEKDDATVRDVMVETTGDGGTRTAREGKTKPDDGKPANQRNQNPTSDKPKPAEKPQAKKPMRA